MLNLAAMMFSAVFGALIVWWGIEGLIDPGLAVVCAAIHLTLFVTNAILLGSGR